MPLSKRLDQLLIDRGLYSSPKKATWAIRSGQITVNSVVIDKPGKLISTNSIIRIKEKLPFVSRGGLKLEKALREFGITIKDKITLDIGCSTGGFTDCLLQNGAKLVYAVDVGYGQLAWSLRNNPKVVLMERTNARHLNPKDFPQTPELVTIDVSFISLDKIIPVIKKLIMPKGEVIALIKPQFEVGPKKAKRGVVKDPKIHDEAIEKIKKAALESGFQTKGIIPSPILGPAGNKEFLCWLVDSR